jgi:TonB family protein
MVVTPDLIDLTLQVSALMVAALVAVGVLRRQSAALRHWVLSVAVAGAACIPLCRAVVPDWTLGDPAGLSTLHAESPASTGPAAEPAQAVTAGLPRERAAFVRGGNWPAHVWRFVPVVWLGGALIGIVVLGTGLLRLAWIERRARPLASARWVQMSGQLSRDLGVRRPVRLLEADHPTILAAWGWSRPTIMMPRGADTWPADRVEVVLRHELAHVARGDWMVQIVAEILRALNWFNPLVWLAAARLRLESERACDDDVIERGVEGPEYAAQLVALARSLQSRRRWSPTFPAPAMARPSSLERRVTAMLNPTLRRSPVTGATRAAVAGLAVVITLSVAGLAVFAQGAASFAGSILDPMSRMIPDTKVVLTNTRTQARHEAVSDASGRFELAGLAPGDYQMEASRPGFSTIKLDLTIAATAVRRDLKLSVGSVQESIMVRVTADPSGPASPAAPPTAQAPRQARPCTATQTGGNILPPIKLRDVRPQYPEHLKAQKLAGLVVVEGVLSGDGSVRDVRVVETPHPDLGQAVVEAVSKWVFEGTRLNCEPIDIKMKVNATFQF